MSGHSKWATIHRQKEVKDARKGVAFTKLAGTITMAVKQGGGIGDPDQNFKLRLAVDKARQLNMPKENITRAIEKGMGGEGGVILEEVCFEGFLPGGAAVLVEALTDNKLRTGQAVRMSLEKSGGTMGSSGSVGYLFSQLGEFRVKADEERILELVDLGITDYEDYGDGSWLVYSQRDAMSVVRDSFLKGGCDILSLELVMKPMTLVEVSEETRLKIEKIVDQLEDLDDVTHVWTNYA